MKKPFIISISCHACIFLLIGLILFYKEKPINDITPLQNPLELSFYNNKKTEQKETLKPLMISKPIHKKRAIAVKTKPLISQKTAKNINKDYHTKNNILYQKKAIVTKKPILSDAKNIQNKAHDTASNRIKKTVFFNENDYVFAVKQKIASHKFYPNTARRRSIEGRVSLKLSIKPDGNIMSLAVIESSGSKILDESALQSVYTSAPFKVAQKIITFQFSISFSLQDS